MQSFELIRYANEGFVNYEQTHLQSFRKTINGCYSFLGEKHEEILKFNEKYKELYPHLLNRNNHKKNSLTVSSDTLIWVKNKKLTTQYNDIYINEDKNFIIIAEEPIQKNIKINSLDFPLSMDSYVEVPISFAYEQYNHLLSIYKWLRVTKGVEEEATINTKILDYCECIIDCNNLNIAMKQMEKF